MIRVRHATPDDVGAVCAIMAAALPAVRPGDYLPDPPEFVEAHIATPEGFTLLAEDEEWPVGFLLVAFPGPGSDNLGRDIGLPVDRLAQVAQMESVAVAPGWWGRGLQRRLLRAAEPLARRRGSEVALCTVAPTNVHSLGNFAALGYRVMARKPMYGGFDRLILAKRLDTG